MDFGGGRSCAFVSLRRSFAFWVSERPAWAGCKLHDLRYAVAKAERAGVVCGIFGIRRKDGKSSAVVVLLVVLAGNEDAVTRMLLNGCCRTKSVLDIKCNDFICKS